MAGLIVVGITSYFLFFFQVLVLEVILQELTFWTGQNNWWYVWGPFSTPLPWSASTNYPSNTLRTYLYFAHKNLNELKKLALYNSSLQTILHGIILLLLVFTVLVLFFHGLTFAKILIPGHAVAVLTFLLSQLHLALQLFTLMLLQQ